MIKEDGGIEVKKEFTYFKDVFDKKNSNLFKDIYKFKGLPDSKTRSEEQKYDNEDLKGKKQDRKQRKYFAQLIFNFTCIWCIGVFFILICTGLNKLFLSENIILALIGTTTVNAFVFMRLVTRYLFNSNGK